MTKKVVQRVGLLVILVLALCFAQALAPDSAPALGPSGRQGGSQQGGPPHAAGQGGSQQAGPPHRRVERAIEALRTARENMQNAEGEFHGHRAKAIERIDGAIHEAEICLQEP
jgi:hypothetical protein